MQDLELQLGIRLKYMQSWRAREFVRMIVLGQPTTRKSTLGHGAYRRPMARFRRPTLRAAKIYSTSDSRSPKGRAAKIQKRRPMVPVIRRKGLSPLLNLGVENAFAAQTGLGATKIFVAHTLFWAAKHASVAHVVLGRGNIFDAHVVPGAMSY